MRTGEFGPWAFTKQPPEECYHTTHTYSLTTTTKLVRTIDEKSSLIHLDATLSVGVLSGLLEVTGSGEYLNEKLDSRRFTKIDHVTTLMTKKVELNSNFPIVRELLFRDDIMDPALTHLITGKIYLFSL
jgi:hypothetical protein